MRNLLLGLVLFTLAAASTVGAAASQSLTAQDFGAGSTSVASCDPNGVMIELVVGLDPGDGVESLVVWDIDERCITQTMTVSLSDATGQILWTTPVYVAQVMIEVPIVNGVGEPVAIDASAFAHASISITERVPLR